MSEETSPAGGANRQQNDPPDLRDRPRAMWRQLTEGLIGEMAEDPALPWTKDRIYHHRSDEDSILHDLDALIGFLAHRDPDRLEWLPLYVREFIACALRLAPVRPLPDLFIAHAQWDGAEEQTEPEALATLSTPALVKHRANLRAEVASGRALLTAINWELRSRQEAAA